MAYIVTVLFDHMLVDETHYFESEADALKCKSALKLDIEVSGCIV